VTISKQSAILFGGDKVEELATAKDPCPVLILYDRRRTITGKAKTQAKAKNVHGVSVLSGIKAAFIYGVRDEPSKRGQ
jgi:hypothetical protein